MLSEYDSFATGVSYQKNFFSSENWIGEIGLDKGRQNWPQSISLVLPFSYSNIQLSASQLYDYHILLDMIEIRTETMPEGTGEFFSAEQFYTIQRYSIALATPYVKIGNSITVGLGVRYHSDKHQFSGQIWNIESTSEFASNAFSLGLMVNFSDDYQLGFQYLSSVEGSGEITDKPAMLSFPQRTAHSFIPKRLSLGTKWSLNTFSGFTSEIEYTSWSQSQSGYTDLISGAASYYHTFKIPELISIGLLLNPAPMSEESLEELRVNAENGLFAIISIHQSLGYGLSIESTIGSSYGISDPWREEIFLNLSVSYGD